MHDAHDASAALPDRESLLRLCERYGVAPAYHDVYGALHTVPSDALAALLQDAGFVAGDGFAAADTAARAAEWEQALPPVQVVASGAETFEVALRLPASVTQLKWRLVDESGAFHEGAVEAASLPIAHSGVAGDAAPAHCYRLAIPLALPEGYHRLSIVGLPGETLVVCAPERCHKPPVLARGGRVWGFTLQLHSLRSRRNWGLGDFTDLADFVAQAARQGADVIGLNPLHALFPHNPAHQSPYSPSSRSQLNVLYIDVEAVPDYRDCAAARKLVRSAAFQERLEALRGASLIDHAGVAAAKHAVLELLYQRFLARSPNDGEVKALARFRAEAGESLREHALFEALQAHLHARDSNVWGWPAWPEAFRDPTGAAVADFAAEHAERIGFFEYLQWQAARQLEAVGARCTALGMAVGLYLDLAVSVDRGGSDAWRHQRAFALDVRVGAPPDAFTPKGQDWGLPPLRPDRLRTSGHAIFIEALRANMRGAGAIRIDHVMMLVRLFWIPSRGTPANGAYVGYPAEELLAILALESQRHGCLVIGEDLGTVPDMLRLAMQRSDIQSYRLLYFERDGDGSFRQPAVYPREAVVAVSTHDLPTLAGWWSAHDLRLRFGLGLVPDGAIEGLMRERAQERERMLDALGQQITLSPDSLAAALAGRLDVEAVAALHAFLAGSPSNVMMVQLEDALGELEQPNLPGTTWQQPNWQRKYRQTVEQLGAGELMRALSRSMARVRPREASAEDAQGAHRTKVPRATYRLQLHSGFTFDDAARIVPYLARLGISHVYCSPISRARPGSMHGYDVVDHSEINPELGGAEAFERFTKVLQAHDMGQLIDLVPNHMGVMGGDNRWWNDVLENGIASRYAKHFDINWQPLTPGLAGKVLVPVLGDSYGEVLGRGELQLGWEAATGEFKVAYFEHRWPLSPTSYADILERARASLAEPQADPLLASLATAFRNLPVLALPGREVDAEPGRRQAIADRARDKELLKAQLAALAADRPAVAEAIGEAVAVLDGPRERDALHALLEAQSFRLAYWRIAADEINYRRFFDVNELAALRTERREVFEASHALALDLAARGWVDGLRIDHPDGLADPARYFERLQDGFVDRAGLRERMPDGARDEHGQADGGGGPGHPERPLYVVAEKIAAPGEDVPVAWAIHGTTGYRFANLANAVLVNERAADPLKRIWRGFTGVTESFEDMVYEAKRAVAGGTLASDLEVLSLALLGLGKSHRRTRDHSHNTLREVLATVAASMTVYRTYNEEQVSAQDRHYIDEAIEAARERLQLPDESVFGFVREALLGQAPGEGRRARRQALRFARRFQQFCAPVAAKGVEDTAFYRYFPLASANEVGGEPDQLGLSVADFHEASSDRQRRWPQTMLATSTHDNKRAEDVRLRINVLSELPGLWRLALRRWSDVNAPLRGVVSKAHEYLLYQTLLGTIPVTEMDAEARKEYRERIVRYMLKAAREGKLGTSWTQPDAGYEKALEDFVDGLSKAGPDSAFQQDLRGVVLEVDRYGALAGISLAILKYGSAGVPDLYQGCELIDRSLVDPDNRRPVDYDERSAALAAMEALPAGEALEKAVHGFAATPSDSRAKLWVIWRMLALRRRWPALFRDGSYEPLQVEGPRADHVIAFLRRHEGRAMVVIAVRLFAMLDGAGERHGRPPELPLGAPIWRDTRVLLPAGAAATNWQDALTDASHTGGGDSLQLAQVLRAFPGAVLVGRD